MITTQNHYQEPESRSLSCSEPEGGVRALGLRELASCGRQDCLGMSLEETTKGTAWRSFRESAISLMLQLVGLSLGIRCYLQADSVRI